MNYKKIISDERLAFIKGELYPEFLVAMKKVMSNFEIVKSIEDVNSKHFKMFGSYWRESLVKKFEEQIFGLKEKMEDNIKAIIREGYNVSIKSTILDNNDKTYGYDFYRLLDLILEEVGDINERNVEGSIIIMQRFELMNRVQVSKNSILFKGINSIEKFSDGSVMFTGRRVSGLYNSIGLFGGEEVNNSLMEKLTELGLTTEKQLLTGIVTGLPVVNYKFYKNKDVKIIFDTNKECQRFTTMFGLKGE